MAVIKFRNIMIFIKKKIIKFVVKEFLLYKIDILYLSVFCYLNY